jgi:hypothetical protein
LLISSINIVEGSVIWNAGEGIQVVSDAIIRNNIIFDCSATVITAAPHAAVPHVRNVEIVNNTIINHTKRKPPFDVGAYEWEFTLKNPGWRIKDGFKPVR